MRIVRVIDLSVPVNAETQTYPGDPVPLLLPHNTIERDGFNILSVRIGSQTGTHVDAPYHFDGATEQLHELPLERFLGPGVVVDARRAGGRGRIDWSFFDGVQDQLGPGRIVLLHTGWSEHYGSQTYFDNPYLDAAACRRLLDLGVRTIGIDALNLDETPDEHHPGEGFPVHHLIAAAGGVIAENLTNLAAVDFDHPIISMLPIALDAADGAPVRAVAIQLAGSSHYPQV